MNAPTFTTAAAESADHLIRMAFEEDLSQAGDLTSLATVPADASATVHVVAREDGFLAGSVLVSRVYEALNERDVNASAVQIDLQKQDGSSLVPGDVIASITGPVRSLLTGERIALNFLIHLSGIASRTAEFVKLVEGSNAVILDTRKTLPAYRHLHKYAVLCGGGTNHRMGLYDGMLIKDNHLAARENSSVGMMLSMQHESFSTNTAPVCPSKWRSIQSDQLNDALQAQPEIVLLDNMNPPQLQQAVKAARQSFARNSTGGVGWGKSRNGRLHRRNRCRSNQHRWPDALGTSTGYRV